MILPAWPNARDKLSIKWNVPVSDSFFLALIARPETALSCSPIEAPNIPIVACRSSLAFIASWIMPAGMLANGCLCGVFVPFLCCKYGQFLTLAVFHLWVSTSNAPSSPINGVFGVDPTTSVEVVRQKLNIF